MPTRLLNTSVLRWPDKASAHASAVAWAAAQRRSRLDIVRIGYFGSYATGRWGVGSDLDFIVVVAQSNTPFDRRSAEWDLTDLPVPADLLVYTQSEWDDLTREPGRFARHILEKAVWL